MPVKNSIVNNLKSLAESQRDKIAFAFLDDDLEIAASFTFGELDLKARSIAAYLQNIGISAGERALLIYSPGVDFIAALMGCLYARIIAVPLYPPLSVFTINQFEAVLANATPQAILTNKAISKEANELNLLTTHKQLTKNIHNITWLETDSISNQWAQSYHEVQPSPDDIAYLQYTSGSTNAPKGVIVRHNNLKANVEILEQQFCSHQQSIYFGWLPLFHDMGLVVGVMQALSVGFTSYLSSPISFIHNPLMWVKVISRYKVTLSGGPNFSYALLTQRINDASNLDVDLSSWALAFCGAEPINDKIVNNFLTTLKPYGFKSTNFYPCYGLAEAVVFVSGNNYKGGSESILRVSADKLNTNSIEIVSDAYNGLTKSLVCHGKPACETKIVDTNTLLECNENQVGELWLADESIAQGYWNSPAETKKSFGVQLNNDSNKGYFRTGDLGFIKDEKLYITGRIKELLIIYGRNYYSHDIEFTAESAHPLIKPGRVVVYEIHTTAQSGLGVIAGLAMNKLAPEKLKETATAIIAKINLEHELQVLRVVLSPYNAIFKTTSGKIKRQPTIQALEKREIHALYDSNLESLQNASSSPPAIASSSDQLEAKLCKILQAVTKCQTIDSKDTFYQIGGDSIRALQTVAKIREELSIEIPVALLFQQLTISELTNAIKRIKQENQRPPLLARKHNNRLPASYSQCRLWFLEQLHPNLGLYNLSSAIRLKGLLDEEAVESALVSLISRHEGLRTTFELHSGDVFQIIQSPPSKLLQIVDLSSLSQNQLNIKLDQLLAEHASHQFCLSKTPPIKISLIKLSKSNNILCLTLHHIIADAWSLGILFEELVVSYNAIVCKQPLALRPSPAQYADFTIWQNEWLQGEVFTEQLTYWKQELESAPETINLPRDYPRTESNQLEGRVIHQSLTQQESQAIKAFAREHGVTVNAALLSAFYLALYIYSGDDDMVIGMPVSNRSHSEAYNIIGFLVNTLALRLQLNNTLSILDLVDLVNKKVLNALMHQDIPLQQLIDELQITRNLNHQPLFQVMFNYIDEDILNLRDMQGIKAELIDIPDTVSKFDITLSAHQHASNISFHMNYSTSLFSEATAAQFLAHFLNLLNTMLKDDKQKISALSPLSASEYHKVVNTWNQTEKQYPLHLTLSDLFEIQAAQLPHNIALLNEQHQLTYAELNSRANQLAHCLQSKGITSDTLVIIFLERSIDYIVSILAILKAGGAYLPLNHLTPLRRLAFIAKNSNAKLIITSHNNQRLKCHASTTPILALSNFDYHEWSTNNPTRTTTPDHLAYVIYTSGSTGHPKGVMIKHIGVVNTSLFYIEQFQLTEKSRCAQFSNMNFDAAVAEIFPALLSGSKLIFIPDKTKQDLNSIKQFYQDNEIDFAFLPTSVYKLMKPQSDSQVRQLVVAGEKLTSPPTNSIVLTNAYGPTESSICATMMPITKKYATYPIGRPISNVKVYIVDKNYNPVPPRVPGELLIGGAGISRGYLNNPKLTAEKFIHNPFGKDPADIVYRTGDICRYLHDGSIEFVERIDHQIKIRSMRVELGEIEFCLLQNSTIKSAVALPNNRSQNETSLAAYIVPTIPISEDNKSSWLGSIKEYIKSYLPDYMRPAHYAILNELPMLENGKIDREALASITLIETEATDHDLNKQEKHIQHIWQKVLKLEHIGKREIFFDLGGSSLSALVLIDTLNNTLGIQLTVRDLFAHPTIQSLSTLVSRNTRSSKLRKKEILNTGNRTKSNAFLSHKLSQWYCNTIHPAYFEGLENIPKQGPIILAVNHHHAFRRLTSLPQLHNLIKHIDSKPCLLSVNWLRLCKMFISLLFTPIFLTKTQAQSDLITLYRTVKLLRQGRVVIMSPEGTNNNGKLIAGSSGVAYLATRSSAKILPVAITKGNTPDLFSKHRTEIRIAPPLEACNINANASELDMLTEKVMRAIANMLPEQQRGVYK